MPAAPASAAAVRVARPPPAFPPFNLPPFECKLAPWAEPGPDGEALFVLVGDFNGSPATYWLERRGRGIAWLGFATTPIFSFNGGVWSAASEHHEEATPGCNAWDPDAPPTPGVATLDQLVLLRLDAPGRLDPLGKAVVPGATGNGEASTSLIALLGPYLVVRSHTYAEDCGAHGNSIIDVGWWSLERRQSPNLQAPAGLRQKALALLREERGTLDAATLREVRWQATLPSFNQNRLTARYLFSAPTDYVSSSWSSYLQAIPIDAPVPPVLQRYANAPSLLKAFDCPDARIVGFSAAPREARANPAVRAAFVPRPKP